MDTPAFIKDLERFASDEARTKEDVRVLNSAVPCAAPSLTTRWLESRVMQPRCQQDIELAAQVQAVVHEFRSTLPTDTGDEVQNMQQLLARLNRLAACGVTNEASCELLYATVKAGTAALNEAIYKRQQFMVVTQDYTALPDKMADEIIRYLTRLKLTTR